MHWLKCLWIAFDQCLNIQINIYICRTFHRDLHPLLVFAQCFGIIPLSVTRKSKVKLFNCKTILCLVVQASIAMMLLTLIYFNTVVADKFDYGIVVDLIFFTNCLAIAINFVLMSRKFPKLLASWRQFEKTFGDEEKSDGSSGKIFVVFMAFAILEHLLSKVVDYESASFCFHVHSTPFEAFSRVIIPTFFKTFSYHNLLAVYVILTCFLSTVLWNFSDVFLITIYFIIFTKLKKFNRKIVEMRFKYSEEKFWLKTRLTYFTIHEKIMETNGVISCLVMLSLLNDFYFVCNQLLGAFKWVLIEFIFALN